MRLKKISLENIRSYTKTEIIFPEGSTLLSGDIGSGKTSILLSIEFALFGLQPGKRGNSLLRNGEEQGKVEMDFEVDGKEVFVERTLKRGKKTITQDYCAITVDGIKEELSVTELKNRVLTLLSYPREFAKKQNILYKFTVYTPQEEMKQIILEDAETRVNTLRHVFGIDKYKKVLENSAIISAKLREEVRMQEGATSNLKQDKESIILKENELEEKQKSLTLIEKEYFSKMEKRKEVEEAMQEVTKKKEEKIKFQQEIEKTQIMISTKKDSFMGNNKLIEQLNQQIGELSALQFDEEKINSLQEEVEGLKRKKQEIMEESMKFSAHISSFSIKNQENEKIKGQISKIDLCPTCLQDVGPVYKSNVFNKLDSNMVENNKEIQKLESQKQELNKNAMQLDQQISEMDKQIRELGLLKIRLEGIKEKQDRVTDLEILDEALKKDIVLLEQHMALLRKSVSDLSRFDSLFEAKQRELDDARTKERAEEIKVAELRREIEVFSRQIEELRERVNKIEELVLKLDYLKKIESWISTKFIPVIAFIEKNVMAKLKLEFSKLFSEWFAILVSDNFNVHLTDDFTPVIEQQDYELDYEYLSGGERTAVALAYRLSLNQVINSIMSKIKTRDLVILDEPTDGFSDQQLDKMRDVLQELNVGQLIIVSHEQKIESFVENVIKLKKENGMSASSE